MNIFDDAFFRSIRSILAEARRKTVASIWSHYRLIMRVDEAEVRQF